MKYLLRLSGLACCLIVLPLASLFAQDTAPSMTVVLSSTDRLKEDLKFMLDLTTPAEQKQWETVEEYLDEVFLLGLDGKRPHRYDLITTEEGIDYRSSFPIADDDDFRENLQLFGINLRRRSRTYYSLAGAYEGVLRFMDDYGVIGQREFVPARGFTPLDATLQKYALKPGTEDAIHDLMFLLLNDNGKPEDRRKAYGDVKKELMAAVKQAEEETQEDFELRKSLTELQVDELGRYYTDPKELVVGWTLATEKKKGAGLIDLLPEEKTPLAAAVAQLGETPSRFETVPEPEEKILSGHLNLPLDDLQKENLTEVVELLAARGKSEADADEDLSDEQKEAFHQMIDLMSASVTDTIEQGRIDGFMQCKPSADGKYTLLGGMKLMKAANITAALKLGETARPENPRQLNVDTHEEVTIHELQVEKTIDARMMDLFGSNKFHIGVGENAFWYAIGTDSMDVLKETITASNAKAEEIRQEFFTFYLRAGPWVEWRARHAEPDEPEKTEKASGEAAQGEGEETIAVDRQLLRKQAMEAFEPGDDIWTLMLKRDEDRVQGEMTVDTGILRLVGKMIAQFSKDTLEE